MHREASILQNALDAAGLTPEKVADLADVAVDDLEAALSGTRPLGPRCLDRVALVFGLPIGAFLDGEAITSSAATLLFRSHANLGLDLDELVSTDGHLALADLMRCSRDLAELRRISGESRSWEAFDALAPAPMTEQSAPYGAEVLAMQVREALGLGLEPIESMSDLLIERFAVDLFWVTPEELSPRIDGASAWAPGPAILVNLVQGEACWWRTRMTLAHELCHLAFDGGLGGMSRGRFFWFSPENEQQVTQRYFRDAALDRREQRANAFAASLLAPHEGVRRLIGDRDPTSDSSVAEVMRHFMVGFETAVNVIRDAYRLSKQARADMRARTRTASRHALNRNAIHPDTRSVRIGLRSGYLEELALRAFSAGRIDGIEVRRLLGLMLTDPLPAGEGLAVGEREPLLPPDHPARVLASEQLMGEENGPPLRLGAGQRTAGAWTFEVQAWTDGKPELWGEITVYDDRRTQTDRSRGRRS